MTEGERAVIEAAKAMVVALNRSFVGSFTAEQIALRSAVCDLVGMPEKPAECRPPERWNCYDYHFLGLANAPSYVPRVWTWREASGWYDFGGESYSPAKIAEVGYTYVAPAVPLVEWSDEEIEDTAAECLVFGFTQPGVMKFARRLLAGEKA
jgi:hypothetical protein